MRYGATGILSCISKGSEGPPTLTTNAGTIGTKFPSPDAPTQFHPTVQQRSIRHPSTSSFDPVGTHYTPKAPCSALPTRVATVYPVTGLAPDKFEKEQVKYGDEVESVFPLD
ncbi:hypothetical protein T265_11486 [Opisthorchis viverrini]|uniref:Uncharacterized protein n=1 Tax=Opisthorchis viverrini TaxID=6198 RepID=A0A074ZXB3_OPIVI|nr:hypothetical protein T265_11486 [Opisthorchis viverrini]KER19834.1 hypothetical protein T265_11486 [Opisthorchis viverrini]